MWAAAGTLPAGGSAQQALLVGGSGLGGVSFGAMWPMLVILISELWGRTHLKDNYLFYDGGCAAVGNLLLANLLPSYIYERAEGHQTNVSDTGVGDSARTLTHAAPPALPPPAHLPGCVGLQCFGPTHTVIIGLSLVSAIAASILALRSTGLYRRAAAYRWAASAVAASRVVSRRGSRS